MPSYNFICKQHDPPRAYSRVSMVPWKKLDEFERAIFSICDDCGKSAERAPNPPGSTVKETLDNGAMRRKVERFRDAERLYKDRAKGGPK